MIDILNMIYQGLRTGDSRYEVIDDKHMVDRQTGVKFHLYPDSFHLTVDGETIAEPCHFSAEEGGVIRKIQQLVYQKGLKVVRGKLAEMYSDITPEPETQTSGKTGY